MPVPWPRCREGLVRHPPVLQQMHRKPRSEVPSCLKTKSAVTLDFPKIANWTQMCWVNVTSSFFSPIQVFRDSTIIPQNSFLKHILSHFSIQPLTCKSNGALAKGMPVEKQLELLRQRLSTIQTCSCTGQGQVRWPLHCFKNNLEIARHTAQNCKGWKIAAQIAVASSVPVLPQPLNKPRFQTNSCWSVLKRLRPLRKNANFRCTLRPTNSTKFHLMNTI